jgi:serine/threonine protein kinase
VDQQRWECIRDLLDSAAELAPERRSSFLAKACGDDELLRAEVEALLEHHEQAGSFLDESPVADLYARLTSRAGNPTFSSGEIISARFRIVDFIGRGGMGEVYKAEDQRLHRLVALKFLPDDIARHPQALNRFQREARAASALNHPSICTVYDISEENGRAFIAMEFLDGQTLKHLISGHQLDLARMLEISIDIADALDAAHAKGIIHRDIKPDNIFINSRGAAKVLDFGLAKLQRKFPGSDDPTITESTELTQHGAAYGTVAYMSPEQARGENLDARTDLFSFGLVMYEMATRRRAFVGSTSASIFASLLKDQPPRPSEINRFIPVELEQIISNALEKDRDLRYQYASDIKTDLQQVQRHRESSRFRELASGNAKPVRVKESYRLRRPRIVGLRLLATILLLVCVSSAGLYVWLSRRNRPAAAPTRVEYTQLTNFVDSVTSPALSPDGRMLAMIRDANPFVGLGEVYVKLLPDGEPVQLTHDDHPKMGLTFSPNGSRIAFTRAEGWDWQTWTVPVLGGEPSELLQDASGLSWVGPHQVMFAEMRKDLYTKIVTASESRANQRDVYLPKTEDGMAHRAYLSPDSKWVLVVEMDSNGGMPCRLVPFAGGSEGKQVGPAPSDCTEAVWSPDGKWMYFSANAGNGFHLWRQRFPDGIAEQITFGATEERGIAVAPDGKSLITSVGAEQSTVWVHSRNHEQQVSFEEHAYLPSLSSDGKTLYYLVRHGAVKFLSGELWSVDLNSGHKQELVPGIPIERYSVSPDGTSVVFTKGDAGDRLSVWLWPLDRRSSPHELATGASDSDTPIFARKGQIFFIREEGAARYVFRVEQDGSHMQKALPNSVDRIFSVSPDENWIVAENQRGNPEEPGTVVAYPLHGGQARVLCRMCGRGGFSRQPPIVSWSIDQKAMFVSMFHTGSKDKQRTIVIPLHDGQAFPKFLPNGFVEDPALPRMPGVHVLDVSSAFPGPDPATYAIWRTSTQRNLYRISLP